MLSARYPDTIHASAALREVEEYVERTGVLGGAGDVEVLEGDSWVVLGAMSAETARKLLELAARVEGVRWRAPRARLALFDHLIVYAPYSMTRLDSEGREFEEWWFGARSSRIDAETSGWAEEWDAAWEEQHLYVHGQVEDVHYWSPSLANANRFNGNGMPRVDEYGYPARAPGCSVAALAARAPDGC